MTRRITVSIEVDEEGYNLASEFAAGCVYRAEDVTAAGIETFLLDFGAHPLEARITATASLLVLSSTSIRVG